MKKITFNIFITIIILLLCKDFINTPINNYTLINTFELYGILFLTVYLISSFIHRESSSFIKKNVFIFTSLIIVELVIYFFKGNFFPEYDNKYYSFHIDNINWETKTIQPYTSLNYQTSEFNFESNTNNVGYKDLDWEVTKNDNTTRIFCLGDSFTEGDGAHKDSSYVSYLRRNLKEKYNNVEVFNAGVCGSDPYFNFSAFKKHILPYQPDIIIQSFTTNDLYDDIYTRGSQERFQEDGSWKSRYDIWWEPIYASSYIFRILVLTVGGYDKFLIKKSNKDQIINESIDQTIKLFVEFNEYCKNHNIDFILFTFPFQDDFRYENKTDKFHQLFFEKLMQHQIEFYYLKNCYDNNMTNDKKDFSAYYWPKDGHHNARGYEMMAKCIENIVFPILENRMPNTNTLLN